ADIDADAKLDASVRRHRDISFAHCALDFCRTTHGFDRACELDQRPVPGRLDDAAAMLVDFRINESSAKLFQGGEGALLVLPHQPSVPRHIGRENSREPSLYPLTGHVASTKHQVSTYGWACASTPSTSSAKQPR